MTTPQHWVRPEILELTPYHVPDASGMVKLDAMENPYALPAELREQWAQRLHTLELNRYPDAGGAQLKQRVRQAMNIPDSAGLLLGNGSDEILQIMMLALARDGASVLTPEPGFAMFAMIARTTGLTYRGVPLDADFQLDVPAMLAAIARHAPALVLIAQPNNPTGNAFDAEGLRAVVEAAPGLVVIDEAYYPFSAGNCLDWLAEYDNLLIMRTVSKLGLAGLRLGLLMGSKPWIEALEPLRLPYNINSLTQASAGFALEHYDAFMQQAAAIVSQRDVLATGLASLPGVTVFPSEANFVLLRVSAGQADALAAGLRDQNVLVKNVSAAHPSLHDCLRITVGTEQENRILLEVLGRLVTDA